MLNKYTSYFRHLILCLSVICLAANVKSQSQESFWPVASKEYKPWTRWWWHGSAVTKEGISAALESYHKAGLGGVEITPIYGVVGYEEKFVNYLTPEWMDNFIYTLREAERLGLGVDMATGTGWPFGGPWIKYEDACKNIQLKIYELKEGATLNEPIEYKQKAYLRAVGNQIHEVGNGFSNQPVKSTPQQTPVSVNNKIDITQLIDPVEENKNLQALAIEQIQFEKPLALIALMAYSDDGQIINLNALVKEGKLNWVAPKGSWKLYALFEGYHGKMVERAGPGGEGNVIDHFSDKALDTYLNHFNHAFANRDLHMLRSFFNDSYEVDDAKGTANWTPKFLDEFVTRRGYDLRYHLPALFGNDHEEKNRRILCDYRQTISELLLENFTRPWKTWAHSKAKLVRNQAHGSPANILDLYSEVDIPEIEGVDPLRIKMASSAGNVMGKKLVSSESATWLNEHFQSNLLDIKNAIDIFFVNGVNHIFYHGTAYSPPGEAWPGWLFYAAVHFNPQNSLWQDADVLNNYVARSQALLQETKPDNDVLLYYPVYDRFSTPGKELIEHFDGIGKQFENTSFERAAKTLMANGYSFDYISDNKLLNSSVENQRIITPGQSSYQVIIIPKCTYMSVSTLEKLKTLAAQGATLMFYEGLPDSWAGYSDYKVNSEKFNESINQIRALAETNTKQDNSGRIMISNQLLSDLQTTRIRSEKLPEGITFIRKKGKEETIYFLVNQSKEAMHSWIPLTSDFQEAIIADPLTGKYGAIPTRSSANSNEVYLEIKAGQSVFIRLYKEKQNLPAYTFFRATGEEIALKGEWTVTFQQGGPAMPNQIKVNELQSWTKFKSPYVKDFSGTAQYEINFRKPLLKSDYLKLDLGLVKESAEVVLNNQSLGKLIGPDYSLNINKNELRKNNKLVIRVSNLMANHIAYLDKNNIKWKKFYNVNFPARFQENRKNGIFDASHWEPKESGLIGPVKWIGLTKEVIE